MSVKALHTINDFHEIKHCRKPNTHNRIILVQLLALWRIILYEYFVHQRVLQVLQAYICVSVCVCVCVYVCVCKSSRPSLISPESISTL